MKIKDIIFCDNPAKPIKKLVIYNDKGYVNIKILYVNNQLIEISVPIKN